jgi:hypothetical protein
MCQWVGGWWSLGCWWLAIEKESYLMVFEL